MYFLHLIEKRKLSYDIKKAKEAKQKCNEQLQRKAAEYDSQIFHLEEQLRKQQIFSNFSVINIVFIFLGKVEVVLSFTGTVFSSFVIKQFDKPGFDQGS